MLSPFTCFFFFGSHLGSEVTTRSAELQVKKAEAEAEVKSMGLAVAHMEEDMARLQKDIAAVGEASI